MKDFEKLKLDVVRFDYKDVIATSTIAEEDFTPQSSYDVEDWF